MHVKSLDRVVRSTNDHNGFIFKWMDLEKHSRTDLRAAEIATVPSSNDDTICSRILLYKKTRQLRPIFHLG